jgi:hypothetical protein
LTTRFIAPYAGWTGFARRQPHPTRVDLEDPVELLERQGLDRARHLAGGAVVEGHVEAPERLAGAADRGRHARGVGEVADDVRRLTAGSTRLLRHRDQFVLRTRREHDSGALPGEQPCCRSPDPPTAPEMNATLP